MQQQQKHRRISLPPDTSVGLSLLKNGNNSNDKSPTAVASTLFFGPLVPAGITGNRGMPPPPPPRVSSTLGRKAKLESVVSCFEFCFLS